MEGVRSCRVTMATAQRTDLTILGLLLLAAAPLVSSQYLGQRIGSLSRLQHDVKGDVFAVDSRTIHIKGFSYDGTAPDAFFYGGVSGAPSDQGFIIPDENGSTKPLGRYNNKDVTLTLPEGVTLKDLKWISVWCRAFTVDLGNVMVPPSLQYPRPQKINALSTLEHGVSSDRIVVVDAQTFLIPNFNYDGSAPGGYNSRGKSNSGGSGGFGGRGEASTARPSSGSFGGSSSYQNTGNSRSGGRSSEGRSGFNSKGFSSVSKSSDRSNSRREDHHEGGRLMTDSVFGGQGGGFGYIKSSSFGGSRNSNIGGSSLDSNSRQNSHGSGSSNNRDGFPGRNGGDYNRQSSSTGNARASNTPISGSALAHQHFG